MGYVYFLELHNGDIYIGSPQILNASMHRLVTLKASVAVETVAKARELEQYFKSGSGKAAALKRFL